MLQNHLIKPIVKISGSGKTTMVYLQSQNFIAIYSENYNLHKSITQVLTKNQM